MANEVVRTITSASGRFRAEVISRSTGGFQVEVFRWNEEWVEGYGKVAEFWEDVSGKTFTDTIERAEELAREALLLQEPNLSESTMKDDP